MSGLYTQNISSPLSRFIFASLNISISTRYLFSLADKVPGSSIYLRYAKLLDYGAFVAVRAR